MKYAYIVEIKWRIIKASKPCLIGHVQETIHISLIKTDGMILNNGGFFCLLLTCKYTYVLQLMFCIHLVNMEVI